MLQIARRVAELALRSLVCGGGGGLVVTLLLENGQRRELFTLSCFYTIYISRNNL